MIATPAALARRHTPHLFAWATGLGRITGDCLRELRHDKIGQLAAALTYHTLFSLLPTLILAMVLLHVFVKEDQRSSFRDHVVNAILPVTDDTGSTTARMELQQAREELSERVEVLLEQLDRFNFGSIGIVGLLVFIYGATALLATVERCFNAILGVARARPWYLRLALYYAVISLAPLPLIAGQVMQNRLLEQIGLDTWLSGPALILAAGMPFATAWLVLFLLYLLLPNTQVPRHAAALGAIVGAIGWALAKEAFRFYVGNAAVSSLYGALALLPLFLLWLWLSWMAVLTGLEFAHTLVARAARGLRAPRGNSGGPAALDPTWLLPVAAAIAEGHARGEPRDVTRLATVTGLHSAPVARMVAALHRAGLILAVQAEGGAAYAAPTWVPARPADRLSLVDLMRAARHLVPAPEDTGDATLAPAWQTAGTLWNLAAQHLGERTLADLAPPADAPAPADALGLADGPARPA